MNFETELESLLNRYSIENNSDTPDFILCEYLKNCLAAYAFAVKHRDIWFNFKPFKKPETNKNDEIKRMPVRDGRTVLLNKEG